MSIRIMPLPVVHPRWEREDSKYPETVKISMSDGKIKTYRLEVEQPKPTVFSQEAIRIMEENSFGGYKGRHLKMTGDAATSTGQRQK